MTDLIKRGSRFTLTHVANADDLRNVLGNVVDTIERTDEMYPVKWDSVRIEQGSDHIRVTVMTEPALHEAGIMDVEPVITINHPPGTRGGTTVVTPPNMAEAESPGTPPRTSFPDTMKYIQ